MNPKVFFTTCSVALAAGAVVTTIVPLVTVAEPNLVFLIVPGLASVLSVAMAVLANAHRGEK